MYDNNDKYNENLNNNGVGNDTPTENTNPPSSTEQTSSSENSYSEYTAPAPADSYSDASSSAQNTDSVTETNDAYQGYGYTNSQNNDSYYGSGNIESTQNPSYTWNTNEAPANNYYSGGYGSTPPAPKKPKKEKRPGGFKRAVAAVMCCVLVSVFSVGGFALLIQNGVINVESQSNNTSAAFTIYKAVANDDSASATSTSSETLSNLSVQEVSEKILPSVVLIQNYQTSAYNYMGGYYGTTTEDESTEVSPTSEGSGIIYSSDGYIVTNAHVISGADNLKVVTYDGQIYEATVVGYDTETDLAVIKITPDTELTAAEFGSSDDLTVGDQVVAVGNPSGSTLSSSVTVGYISALNREITNSDTGYTMNYIQTDAAINPGNSGGALVNMYGQVIGINTAKVSATGYEGLGFSIPTDEAQSIVTELMNYGYVKDRAVMGITGEFVDSTSASFFGIASGWYVSSTTTENAANSGLQRADVITAIDDTQVTSSDVLKSYIKTKKPGDTVELTVVRASTGETLTLSLVLSETTNESESTTTDENTQGGYGYGYGGNS